MEESITHTDDDLLKLLHELQKRSASATDWNASTEGKRLLDLEDYFAKKNSSPLTPEENNALAMQSLKAKLTPEESEAIRSANTKSIAQKPTPRVR